MKKLLFLLVVGLTLQGVAQEKPLKHFLLIGTPKPETVAKILEHPMDLGEPARIELEGMGGMLIGYYFAADHSKNYALLALPGSRDMAAIVYQRMATGAMENIEVIELIPSDEMIAVFKKASKLNNKPKN